MFEIDEFKIFKRKFKPIAINHLQHTQNTPQTELKYKQQALITKLVREMSVKWGYMSHLTKIFLARWWGRFIPILQVLTK